MSRVLLNASPLVIGGAIQACVAFIRQSMQSDDGIHWSYAVSKEIADELARFDINISTYNAIIVSPSPARSKASREALISFTNAEKPDVVFTFFGPAYVKFSQPHLMGVANGWVTHSSKIAFNTKSTMEKLRFIFSFFIRRYWYKQADRWVVEAACAKKGMEKRFSIESDRIAIAPNNCSDIYAQNQSRIPDKIGTKIRLLTLSAYYPHKNLEIIPRVAYELQKKAPHLVFEFVLTIKAGKELEKIMDEAHRYGVTQSINNRGPVSVIDGPALYANTDIVFMPSLLETFSAVYPEAMASGCPIVTTDLHFARDICGDAALYYAPLDPASAAAKILEVVNTPGLFSSLVEYGRKRLEKFPSPEQKYQLYLQEIKTVQAKGKKV